MTKFDVEGLKHAEVLNQYFRIKSDCFELDFPKFDYIVCPDMESPQFVAHDFKFKTQELYGYLPKMIEDRLFSPFCHYEQRVMKHFLDGLPKGKILFVVNKVVYINLLQEQNYYRTETLYDYYFYCVEDYSPKEPLFRRIHRVKHDTAVCPTHILPTCLTYWNQPKNVDYIIAYDDYMRSAFEASAMFKRQDATHGVCGPSGKPRKIICLGGKGLMSQFLYGEEEGVKLAQSCMDCGIAEDDIFIEDGGKNTTDNLNALDKYAGAKIMFMVSQRLSDILKSSIEQQKPQWAKNVCYYVIEETVYESCNYYSGMALDNNSPILHFWAHMVPRYEKYAGTFMLERKGEYPQKVREADAYLRPKYLIKQRANSLRKYFQYIPILMDLFFHKGEWFRRRQDIERERLNAVRYYREIIGIEANCY